MHPKFEPSSQPLPGNFQPHFQPELNDRELGSDEFTPAGKSPQQLVKRVQQRMKEGKKLTNQEMHWAFSHGGFYFHQQAGVHQQRMRMKEDAERKKLEGSVATSSQDGDLETGALLGVSSQAQDGKGDFTASPVLGDVKGEGNITASPLVDASQEEQPLSVMEKKEAQKENGQVTPLDASQNAVEQPVLGVMQPKAEESGEEKRRKEGVNTNPDLQQPAANKADAVSQIQSSHDKVMEQETKEAESQLPVKANRKKGQPTVLEPKPGTETFTPKTGLPSPSQTPATVPVPEKPAEEKSPIDQALEAVEKKSDEGDEKLAADLIGQKEKAQSEAAAQTAESRDEVKPGPEGVAAEFDAQEPLAEEEIVADSEEEEEPLPSVDQSILEALKAQILATGEAEKAKMHEQNAAKRAAFSQELAQSRENYQLEMQGVYTGISDHFSAQRGVISSEGSKHRNQIEQTYKKQQQALDKATGDKRKSLFDGASKRKADFLKYVADQKQEPYNIARDEGKRVDTELNQAASKATSVGEHVAGKYPGSDDTKKEQRNAAREVAKGANEEILAQKQPMKEDLLARAEEFDGGFDQYTEDTLQQIDTTRDQIDPELDKLSVESGKALTANYQAALDAVNKKEKAALGILNKQENAAIQQFKKAEAKQLEESMQAEQELMASLDEQDAQTALEIDQLAEHATGQLTAQPGVEESAYQALAGDAVAEIQQTSTASIAETAATADEVKTKLAEGFTASVAKAKEGAAKANEKASALAKTTKTGFAKVTNDFKTESQKLVDKLPQTLGGLVDGAYAEVDKALEDRKGKLKATNDKFREELKEETDENLLAAKAPLTDDLKDRATEAAEEAGKSWLEAVFSAIGSIVVGLLIVIAAAIVLVALGLCSTILGAMLLIGLAVMAFTFLTSLVSRLQMGQGWAGVGWALADAFGVTGLIEAKTGKDSWTGEVLSDYQRTKRGTESGITVLLTLLGARGARGPKNVRIPKIKLNIKSTVKNSKPYKALSKYNKQLENFGASNRQTMRGNNEVNQTWRESRFRDIYDGIGAMEKGATSFFRGIDKTVNTLFMKPASKTISGIVKTPKMVQNVFKPKPKVKQWLGARGEYSGREYNPANAGGPVRQLSYNKIKITRKGVDVVKEHLSRFERDGWNLKMIERLEAILEGKIKPSEYDLRFYSHELREFVRYRKLGHKTGNPDGVWDDTHAATLEDYRLADLESINGKDQFSLYHPDVQKTNPDEFGMNEKLPNSVISRVQGGQGANQSRTRIYVDEFGNINIVGKDMLYITLDDINHSVYFYEKRGGANSGVEIVSFEISPELAAEIKNSAIPQYKGKLYPDRPQASDPTKSTGAYGLPKEWINKLLMNYKKGSGKNYKP